MTFRYRVCFDSHASQHEDHKEMFLGRLADAVIAYGHSDMMPSIRADNPLLSTGGSSSGQSLAVVNLRPGPTVGELAKGAPKVGKDGRGGDPKLAIGSAPGERILTSAGLREIIPKQLGARWVPAYYFQDGTGCPGGVGRRSLVFFVCGASGLELVAVREVGTGGDVARTVRGEKDQAPRSFVRTELVGLVLHSPLICSYEVRLEGSTRENDLSPAIFFSVAVRVVQVQDGRTLLAASVPSERMSRRYGILRLLTKLF